MPELLDDDSTQLARRPRGRQESLCTFSPSRTPCDVQNGQMDFEQLASDMLRAQRGRRSQLAWSRRLGFKSNVAYAWESGRAFPTAASTLAVFARHGVDLRAVFVRFYQG